MLAGGWAFCQNLEKKDKYDDPRLNTPVSFTLGDRDRLHTVELKMEALEKTVDVRFDAMQKQIDARFDAIQRQMDTRFEAVDRRLDAMDKRFDFLQSLLWTIVSVLLALCGGIVALAVATYMQMQRINKLLARHDGILTERQRREAETNLIEDVAQLKRDVEAVRRGAAGSASGR